MVVGWSELPKALWEIRVTASGSEFRTLTNLVKNPWVPFFLIFLFRLMCFISTHPIKSTLLLKVVRRGPITLIFCQTNWAFFHLQSCKFIDKNVSCKFLCPSKCANPSLQIVSKNVQENNSPDCNYSIQRFEDRFQVSFYPLLASKWSGRTEWLWWPNLPTWC